jgi:prolyl-tRNA synthetase
VLAVDRAVTDEAKSSVEIWLVLVRGDHEVNEIKAGKIEGLNRGFRVATETEIEEHFGCRPGYLGPISPRRPIRVVADRTVANMSDFVRCQ